MYGPLRDHTRLLVRWSIAGAALLLMALFPRGVLAQIPAPLLAPGLWTVAHTGGVGNLRELFDPALQGPFNLTLHVQNGATGRPNDTPLLADGLPEHFALPGQMAVLAGSSFVAWGQANPTTPPAGVRRTSLPIDGNEVVALLASPRFDRDHTLYLVAATALWRSTDAGVTWMEAANLPAATTRRFSAGLVVAAGEDQHVILLTTLAGELWRIDPTRLTWTSPVAAAGELAIAISYAGGFYTHIFDYAPEAPNIRHYVLILPVTAGAEKLERAAAAFGHIAFPQSAAEPVQMRSADDDFAWALPYLHLAPGGRYTATLAPGDYAVWAAFIAAPASRAQAGAGADAILWAGITGGGASTREAVTVTVAPGATKALAIPLTDANGWACPWLYVDDGSGYVRVTEVLRNLEGAAQARHEVTALGRVPVVDGKVRLRVAEEKDEITYLDMFAVIADGVTLVPRHQQLVDADGVTLQIERGEHVDLEFSLPPALAGCADVQLTVVAAGYYRTLAPAR